MKTTDKIKDSIKRRDFFKLGALGAALGIAGASHYKVYFSLAVGNSTDHTCLGSLVVRAKIYGGMVLCN